MGCGAVMRGRGREREKVLVVLAIKHGDVKRKQQEKLKQSQVNMKQYLKPILLLSCFKVISETHQKHTEM